MQEEGDETSAMKGNSCSNVGLRLSIHRSTNQITIVQQCQCTHTKLVKPVTNTKMALSVGSRILSRRNSNSMSVYGVTGPLPVHHRMTNVTDVPIVC